MGYWVTAAPDYDYYEGDRISLSDIAVTQIPHTVCEWDGAAWTYPLAAAQDYQKRRVVQAMHADINSTLSAYYCGQLDLMMMAVGMIEATAFEDDTGRSAGSVAFLDAYKTERGLGTLQDAADEIQSNWASAVAAFGKAFAQKQNLFDSIGAETDGATVLTYEWVPV
jgi:hypothetical protein